MGEVERMFVLPAFRGQGIARAVLAELEKLSAARGDTSLRLETGTLQRAAISLYESAGYVRIPVFGEYLGGAYRVCFEKRLTSSDGRTT
jgi:ribosomal protein S18 acetylase RimI-like enzyme